MTPADLRNCMAFLDRLIRLTGPALGEIALLSPNYAQFQLVRNAYRGARIHILTIDDWNIADAYPYGFDLIVANNVLHYVREPATAIANLMRSAHFVWIQDLIDRERGELGFAADGDCMRYSFTPHFKSGYDQAFDLSVFADRISDFQVYAAEQAHGEAPACHFTVALSSGPVAGNLPARPFRALQQMPRRARIGSGHLWHSVMKRMVRSTTSPPPTVRSDPSISRTTDGGDA